MKHFVITLLLAAFMLHVQGQNIDSVNTQKNTNWYAGVHFAGNTGFVSCHFGYSFLNNKLNIAAGYGYLPKAVNGVEVHNILLKTSYNFSRDILIKKAYWYIGVNTIFSFADNTYYRYPSFYPKDYYSQNAIHFAPHLGLKVPFFIYKPVWAKDAYFHTELGTLDNYLWYSITNKSIRIWDIWNISFGVSFDI
jgi:hypothetical protein